MLGQENKKCGCNALLGSWSLSEQYLCSPTNVMSAIDLTKIMCDCVGEERKKVELGESQFIHNSRRSRDKVLYWKIKK